MSHPGMAMMLDVQDMERELKELKVQTELVATPLERAKARRIVTMTDLDKLKRQLEATKLERRQAEVTLADAEARVRSAQARQLTATSTREVADLERMLDQAAAQVSTVEEVVLNLLEKEEEQEKRLAQAKERTDRDIEKIDAEIQRLSGLLKERQEMTKALLEERIAGLNRMDEEVRENYEWLVKKHGATQAVAYTTGGACGGCGAMLLPDQLNKVKDPSQLYRCTHCYRYLLNKD